MGRRESEGGEIAGPVVHHLGGQVSRCLAALEDSLLVRHPADRLDDGLEPPSRPPRSLVPEAGEVSIVSEQRHEMSDSGEVVLHQVRMAIQEDRIPEDRADRSDFTERLVTLAEIWARQCIHERHADITEL